ncbi:MAG: outer membrane lipoprotein-sorting protein [Polymorphobacter sp.]|uniref:outer membrane lipoprotein-sorting protein n=1 Tax=Polymorphobacter sp. TaxID=1909290 RepID=UPI003A87D1CE
MFERIGLVIGLAAIFATPVAAADGLPLARAMAERPDNVARTGLMRFRLVNKRGSERLREAIVVHGEDKAATRTLIHFNRPAGISGTAFLTEDRKAGADEAWLFLPATDRVRRLPASDRGDSFLGTDLSYGDIRDNFRFPLEDWAFQEGARKSHRGKPHRTLSGKAVSADAAKEMGYGSFEALVDPDTLLPMRIDFTDPEGAARKRVEVIEAGQVDGVWTALRFTMTDARSGHMTEVTLEGLRALAALPARVFEADRLADGPPRLP